MNNSFELAQIFSNNMVLQRNIEIAIWGKAPDGMTVRVEFCGQIQITQASSNGEWFVMLMPVKEGGPHEMEITCGIHKIVLENILVGEVWIAGGQSNMEYLLWQTREGKSEIPAADFPGIRYYHVPKIPYENALKDAAYKDINCSGWKLCNSQNAGQFSAIAFHFAVKLNNALNVPVGIINCNWGATSASCWMSEEYLLKDPETRIYLDEYYEQIKKLDMESYKEKARNYEASVKAWNERRERIRFDPDNVDAYFMDDSAGAYPWPPPQGPWNPHRPSGLYYSMLREIVPYSIKGVIFYQGESDMYRPYLYRKLFSLMIQNWREDWKQPQLPFLFVQIASFDNGNSEGEEWPGIRESQLFVSENMPYTAMVTSIDCGDHRNIHPTSKKTVAERLALMAGTVVYGQNKVCSGPIYKNMQINKSRIILRFKNVGLGLEAKGGALKGFKICGEDKKFFDAKAEIKGDVIEVFSNKVLRPLAVYYGWANYTDANLYNKDGFPASPFRTHILS